MLASFDPEVVACVMTGGALFGLSLAYRLNIPCVFVGKGEEGVNYPEIAHGKRVLLVEDVVTTGGSTTRALEKLEAAGAAVLAVATYGLARAEYAFAVAGVPFYALTTIEHVMDVATRTGRMSIAHQQSVQCWLKNPY